MTWMIGVFSILGDVWDAFSQRYRICVGMQRLLFLIELL
jgi:hypothetical protein